MQENGVMECVVYRIHEEKRREFAAARQQVLADIQASPGFVSFNTLVSTEDSAQMIDFVWWEDADAAQTAYEAWKHRPSAKLLMQVVETVSYSGHFRPGGFEKH